MTDASARGRNNRRRGQSGERELCMLLRAEFGIATKRNLGQERDSGTDVHIGPFRIEVKRRKRIAGLYEWLGQAIEVAAEVGEYPALAVRADGQQWLVVMTFEDWATLAREEIAADAV